jgi:predicted transglutaminase-like cysteine proteinase
VQLLDASLGMVPSGKRTVTPVPAEMKALVPRPEGTNQNVKSNNADPVRDTVPLIKRIVARTLYQTKKLAARLKASTVAQTVRNNYNFVFKHIQYQKDPAGKEQVRSPRRLVYDGKGDCDCFVTFLSSLLTNQGISHKLRVTKYNGSSEYSHIYIIVPTGSGYITLDPVVHQFNYEVPFSSKQDFDMKLESLDGPEALRSRCNPPPPKRRWVRGSQLRTEGKLSVGEVLLEEGIQGERFINAKNETVYQVKTNRGLVTLPPVIAKEQRAQLVAQVTGKPQPVLVSDALVSNALSPKISEDMKTAGKVLAGLALTMLLLNAIKPSRPGLSGTQPEQEGNTFKYMRI